MIQLMKNGLARSAVVTGKPFKEDAGRLATLHIDESHGIEYDVRRRLLSRPELRFSSLVVRRIVDGVCLEGVVETDGNTETVGDLVASVIEGVDRVMNRLVVRSAPTTPARKG